jgi:hypothetical protein
VEGELGMLTKGVGIIRRLSLTVGVTAAAFLMLLGRSAAATFTVGQDFAPGTPVCANVTMLQTGVSSDNSYAVPATGVITSWSFHNGPDVLPNLKFKVARPQPDGSFVFVGDSVAGTQQLNTTNTYPTNIPVQAGDVIGFFEGPGSGHCALQTGSPNDTRAQWNGDTALNTALMPPITSTTLRFPVSATVSSTTLTTGQRAAALASCKKRARTHHWSHKRLKKCKKSANRLPV